MKSRMRYIYSLDSMRVLAMLGVMLFHLFPDKVSGGFLGVITFFVLSGFFMMREIVVDGNQNPIRSMAKKIKKLMPELIVMVFVTVVVMSVSLSEYLPDVKNQAISSIFGINNIAQIRDGESYFAAMAALKPFTHIWALSMELQFYFFLLFSAGAFYRKKHKYYWVGAFFILASVSVFLMQFFFVDVFHVTRIYYGTDTRIFSFLIGAIGAIFFADRNNTVFIHDAVHSISAIALMMISTVMFFTVKNGEAVYRYLFVLYSLMQLCLLYLLSVKKTFSYRLFSRNFIVMMSKRSYSLYLWHFPVMKIYEKWMWHQKISIAWYIILEFIFILAITEFFYRLFYGLKQRQNTDRHEDSINGTEKNNSEKRHAGKSKNEKRGGKKNHKKRNGKGARNSLPAYALMSAVILFICIYPYKPIGPIANEKYLMLLSLKSRITDVGVNIGGVRDILSPTEMTTATTDVTVVSTSDSSSISSEPFYSDFPFHSSPVIYGEIPNDKVNDVQIPKKTNRIVIETQAKGTDLSYEITDSSTDPDVAVVPTMSDSVSETESSTVISAMSSTVTSTTLPSSSAVSFVEDPEIAYIREVYDRCRLEYPNVNVSFEEYLRVRNHKITLIGDSISVMTSPKLVEFFPNIEISAKSNRQCYHAYEFYSQLKAEGRIGDVVILALGANGDIDYETFDLVRTDLGGKPLIINTVILPWPVTESERNESIYNYAKERDNVYVAKWFEHCKNKEGILYDDGVHPIETVGAEAHAYVMMEAIYSALIKGGQP